jgi:hypothetical protein
MRAPRVMPLALQLRNDRRAMPPQKSSTASAGRTTAKAVCHENLASFHVCRCECATRAEAICKNEPITWRISARCSLHRHTINVHCSMSEKSKFIQWNCSFYILQRARVLLTSDFPGRKLSLALSESSGGFLRRHSPSILCARPTIGEAYFWERIRIWDTTAGRF